MPIAKSPRRSTSPAKAAKKDAAITAANPGTKVTRTQLPKAEKPATAGKVKQYKDSFDPAKFAAAAAGVAGPGELMDIDLSLIDHNPKNKRTEKEINADPATDELASTIKQFGLAQPIVVRKVGKRFEVVAGCRRRVACLRAGLVKAPCMVRAECDDTAAAILRVLENLQRKDLTPIQQASEFATLQELLKLTQSELAARVGKSQAYVSQRLSLLKLNKGLQAMLDAGQVTITQGREVAIVADVPRFMTLIQAEFDRRLKAEEQGGEPLDNENFCYAFGGVLEVTMRPMEAGMHKGPSFHASAEQLHQLDVRQLCLDGTVKEKWAANVALWDKLDKEAKESAAAREAEKSAKPATGTAPATPAAAAPSSPAKLPAATPAPGPGPTAQETGAGKAPAAAKPAAQPLTEAEQKERDERAAAAYNKRLYRYKCEWLQLAIAKVVKEITAEQHMALMIAFAMDKDDHSRRDDFAHAVKEVTGARYTHGFLSALSIDRGKLPKILANFVHRWCQRDARSHIGDARPELIEALAKELGIDMAATWTVDRKFLDLQTTEQLWDLVSEWQLSIKQDVSGKGPLTDAIAKHPKAACAFPKCLKKVKAVHLD